MHRRLHATVGVAVLTLGLAACGGGGDAGSAGSCEDLAGEAAVLIEDLVAEAEDLTLADMAEMEEGEPEFLVDFEEQGEALDERQQELGCSDDEMTELLAAELEDVEAEPGSMGALLLEAIRSDGLGVAGE